MRALVLDRRARDRIRSLALSRARVGRVFLLIEVSHGLVVGVFGSRSLGAQWFAGLGAQVSHRSITGCSAVVHIAFTVRWCVCTMNSQIDHRLIHSE